MHIGSVAALFGLSQDLSGKDLVEELAESQPMSLRLEDLAGRRMNLPGWKDGSPDAVLAWFFSAVRENLGLDFRPLISEQFSPLSFSRWQESRAHKVSMEPGTYDAAEVFHAILAQSLWHWSYSRTGQIVIHAWHKGDRE